MGERTRARAREIGGCPWFSVGHRRQHGRLAQESDTLLVWPSIRTAIGPAAGVGHRRQHDRLAQESDKLLGWLSIRTAIGPAAGAIVAGASLP